jgi:magnesium transporter
MSIAFSPRAKKIGLPPGSPVYTGSAPSTKAKVDLIYYEKENVEHVVISNPAVEEQCRPFLERKQGITWINVTGLHDADTAKRIASLLDLHPLVVEDILNTTQRPKAEDYDRYLYIDLRMLFYNEENQKIDNEQVSMVVSGNYVVSFHDREAPIFNTIRQRIEQNTGHIRQLGADYLAYNILDLVIDGYFLIIENLEEEIERIDDVLTSVPPPVILEKVHSLIKKVGSVRKSVWPLRALIDELRKEASPFIKKNTQIYLRDVYEHAIYVIDEVESFRDVLSSTMDIYLSSNNYQMNTVMKTLTIITTIFMPLSLLASIYGMNFAYMPELKWRYGYPIVLLIMLGIVLGMLYFFKRKKWL